MSTKEARLRANAKYKNANIKQVVLAFFPDDMELLDYLNTKKPKATYVKDLIRKDMEANKED